MGFMFMPLRRYAEFSGRSQRSEFWLWFLFQFLLYCTFFVLIFSVGGAAIAAGNVNQLMAGAGTVILIAGLYLLVALAFFIPNLAVTIRRLHDTGRSGWWVMLFWGPYILSAVLGPSRMSGVNAFDSNAPADGVTSILSLAVLVGCIVLLIFMCLDGTQGPNQYGPDPKERTGAGDVFA